MNKKSILASAALLALAVLLLLGLPFTSQQIIQRRMAQPAVDTLAPSQDLQLENNSLTT